MLNNPLTLTSKILSKSFSLVFSIFPTNPIPALLIRISILSGTVFIIFLISLFLVISDIIVLVFELLLTSILITVP